MHKTGNFSTRSGMRLFMQQWLPEGPACAHVVLLHGFADHSNRYGYVADRFNEKAVAVHAFDQRGHGRSSGRRAYVRRFDDFLEDLDDFRKHVEPAFNDKPCFIMGHSMGGMVLARYAQSRSILPAGLIFSSPFLGMNDDVPRILLGLASILSKVAPNIPVGKVDNSGLSRDKETVRLAEQDPLMYHGKVSARTGAEFYRNIKLAEAAYSQIEAPALIFHGSDDRIVPPSGSRKLHEGIRSADKTLKIYDGGYHELWNDLCKEEVMNDVLKWVTDHITRR